MTANFYFYHYKYKTAEVHDIPKERMIFFLSNKHGLILEKAFPLMLKISQNDFKHRSGCFIKALLSECLVSVAEM